MLARLLENHVLANLVFTLVLVMGALSYAHLPREQNPEVNFNWIDITTTMPGASALDIEKRVTNPLEEALRSVRDIRFVASTSREGISKILVRFNDIDADTFDKRTNDLRRELQNEARSLPEAADEPTVVEVTTANSFPTATVVIVGPAADANLRGQAELSRRDIERIPGVDRIVALGLTKPELQIDFFPERLEGLAVAPSDLADTVDAFYRDTSAGSLQVNGVNWMIRLIGTDRDPSHLARLPVLTARGEVPLGSLAEVKRGRTRPAQLVSFDTQPAVMFGITKRARVNDLELVERISAYIEERNAQTPVTGVRLILVDDQTQVTRDAIRVMQVNALLGFGLVLIVTCLFLGARMALLTCLGIPFILAGTFWILELLGHTLNVSVLLGVVISLGMLVDDAVVVVEAIYYRLERGATTLEAALRGLAEVMPAVTTAVLTTVAAFLPLMLLPGLLGQFMLVIPLVVTLALAASLVEAYWMLPAHVIAANIDFNRSSRAHRIRVKAVRRMRTFYARLLIRTLRYPKTVLSAAGLLFLLAGGAVAGKLVKVNFFASDPMRLFYINVQMPPGTPLTRTLDTLLVVETAVRGHLREDESRSMVSYSGQMFTATEPLFGEQYGQVMVALNPMIEGARPVDEVIEAMRGDVMRTVGPVRVSFLRLAGGPPVSKPVQIKVRGDNFEEIKHAVDELKTILRANPAVRDISDDVVAGPTELALRIDLDAARRARLDPGHIARNLRLLIDGEVVASMQDQGQKLEIRVRARNQSLADAQALLHHTLSNGSQDIPLRAILRPSFERGDAQLRHHDFRRSVTVEADIDKTQTDTLAVNNQLMAEWRQIRSRYPNVDLDFSGVFDDIEESLDAIKVLSLFGLGLIYLILGTQFKSYFQPLLILLSVPMAFTGVVLGLLITGNPLSLITLYGVVALAGIAVNAAIVLISAANKRLKSGMSVGHATVYAARRRVVPIVITTLTTIAGLSSLAVGLGGHSLLWGPVATAIVWGLAFSSVLTLSVIPVLYCVCTRRPHRPASQMAHPVIESTQRTGALIT